MNKEVSILIVEDHELTRDGLMALLSADYNCAAVSNAEEAIRLLRPLAFNLVITDIKMPGASGIDLCTFVHEMSPDTVVIAISGQADIRDQAEAMRSGALYYIEKPIDPEKLLVLVESALKCQALAAARYHYERMLARIDEQMATLNEQINTPNQPSEKTLKAKV